MASTIFQQFGAAPAPVSNFNGIVQAVKQMQQTFQGDPQQTVQSLLQSGQMSPAQYNALAQTAKQIMPLLGGN